MSKIDSLGTEFALQRKIGEQEREWIGNAADELRRAKENANPKPVNKWQLEFDRLAQPVAKLEWDETDELACYMQAFVRVAIKQFEGTEIPPAIGFIDDSSILSPGGKRRLTLADWLSGRQFNDITDEPGN